MTSADSQFDIAIIGGGPAGTACAMALCRCGWSVLLVERSDYSQPRIGETLPPEIKTPLAELGLWQPFLTQQHRPCHAIYSAWGGPQLAVTDFMFNPYGTAWHVDRARFDGMLCQGAEASGATVLQSTRLVCGTCADYPGNSGNSGKWRLQLAGSDSPRECTARFLVDATGRCNVCARMLGVARKRHDRLIGVAALLDPAITARTGQSRQSAAPVTLIESGPAGWWYCAPLPNGQLVAVYLTDSHLWRERSVAAAIHWQAMLAATRHTRARLKHYQNAGRLRVFSAAGTMLERVAGSNWLAVGDAACALDPLAGQGVYQALQSGIGAGRAIDAGLRGDPALLHQYSMACSSGMQRYLAVRREYYRREMRWEESDFWQQRGASYS